MGFVGFGVFSIALPLGVPELKLASLDISNMYTNILTKDIISIINSLCKNHNIEDTATREIISITKLITCRINSASRTKRVYKTMD